jgi:hypothetical protein
VQAYRPVSAEAKADKAKDGGPQER